MTGKKLQTGLWIAALSIFSLTAGLVFRPEKPALNRYELAQRKTVLLTVGDGQGSGVVIKRESISGTRLFVWTAAHVVEGFSEVEVSQFIRFENRRVGRVNFKAKVLVRDSAKDLALLWLDAPPSYFGAAEFDFDVEHRVGDFQYHVGNFYGEDFDTSVSTGILSQFGIKPAIPDWPWATPLDQTTCAAIFGSSGGPVFDSHDKVCGLIVGGPVGKGFVEYVPSREILKWAEASHVLWAVKGRYCPSDLTLENYIPIPPKKICPDTFVPPVPENSESPD